MAVREYTTCYRKKKHQTAAQADTELLRLQSVATKKFEVYFCQYCGFWHIGGTQPAMVGL